MSRKKDNRFSPLETYTAPPVLRISNVMQQISFSIIVCKNAAFALKNFTSKLNKHRKISWLQDLRINHRINLINPQPDLPVTV